MRKLTLASVAILALGLPALANDQGMHKGSDSMGQTNGSASRMNGNNTANAQSQSGDLSASELNKDAIKEVQQALNDKGFDAGKVDGIWGPETVSAIKKFQEKNNLKADGKLDHQTVAALGLSQQQEPTTTGSGSSSDRMINDRAQERQGQQNKNPSNGMNHEQTQPQSNGSGESQQ